MREKGKNEDILTLLLQYIFVGNASIYESAGEVYLLAHGVISRHFTYRKK